MFPPEMLFRNQWVRRDGKRPIRVDGRPASSTDSSTWSSFEAAATSRAGDGLGIMLGNGLGCLDLDHCMTGAGELKPWAAAELERAENVVFVEVSMSGTGLHVFLLMPEGPGHKVKQPDGGVVETYSRARFIACTGRSWEVA